MNPMYKIFSGIFCGFVILLLTTVVIAKEIEMSPSSSSQPTPQPAVEYILPYPGLLPDNPLYPFKAVRDRILGIMTINPVKRVEFNLLMADKRLQMGIFLSEKGKEKLAETTIAKGEKYLFVSAQEMAVLKPREDGLQGMLDRLNKAIIKHREAITQLKAKSSPEFQTGYDASLMVVAQAGSALSETK